MDLCFFRLDGLSNFASPDCAVSCVSYSVCDLEVADSISGLQGTALSLTSCQLKVKGYALGTGIRLESA